MNKQIEIEIEIAMEITYKVNASVSVEQFIALMRSSSLGDRRPIENYDCIKGMINNSNLVITAWDDEELVGIARSVTDLHYACYLSDLAVDKKYQNKGIGKNLLVYTQKQLQQKCKLILIAAPAADSYYQHLGFTNNSRCWTLEQGKVLDKNSYAHKI